MSEYIVDYRWLQSRLFGQAKHLRDDLTKIVRCRDCVHSSVSFDETRTMCRYWSMNDYDDSESSHGYTLYPVVKPDGFCAWGKRVEQ